jgi:hypothetical protein
VVRQVEATAFRMFYDPNSRGRPPEIAAGALVELYLFGDSPAGYYRYLRANPGCLGDALRGLDDAVGLALAATRQLPSEIEQAVAEQRRPDDLSFWTGIVDRIWSVALETTFAEYQPAAWGQVLKLIGLLTGAAGRELLGQLVVCCEIDAPLDDRLDHALALLGAAVEQVRALEPDAGPERLPALRRVTPVVELPPSIEWQRLGAGGASVLHCENPDEILAGIDFAVGQVGLCLSTLELGFCDGVVHGIRAVKA